MLERDETLIRRPVLTGQQLIEGMWFSSERFSEDERSRLILRQWQTGARAYRFADGDLLRFRQPLSVRCEALAGWPLIRQGRALCSARLTPEEMSSLPAADVWLVRGSQVGALQFRDAESLAPGRWLDISGYTLLDTYDCRSVLPEPALEPVAALTDVREILGGPLGPVSPEREGIMQALHELQRNAPKTDVSGPGKAPTGKAKAGKGKTAERSSSFWLNFGLSLPLFAALFWAMSPDEKTRHSGLPTPASAAAASSDGSGFVLAAMAGALVIVLLLIGLFTLFRPRAPARAVTPVAASRSALAPRATPVQPKPSAWRRWLTRLTLNSRLSALYGKRQAAYMRRMLEMFENGDLQEALRHAIPLGDERGSAEQAFGTPQRRQDLEIGQQRGPVRSMLFEEGFESHLKKIYRQTFARLDREGRIEEAVFVLAELLQVRQEALDYLEKHGRYQQAADLALAWDMPAGMIVRLLCVAGNWQRALQVARRDDAFADAVVMLQAKWPESADRLRLEWAEALTGKGLWLQAVDVIWSLPAERARAAQWLLNAEAAGGRLAIGALVKRAILLPDTLQAYSAWVEQLRNDPQRYAERAALAEALLLKKAEGNALAWLAGATVHAILADQASGHGLLTQIQLQALVKISRDKLLQADLPGQLPPRVAAGPLHEVSSTLAWEAPEEGTRTVLAAVALEDNRYLLALGEAGALVIDATGKTVFHFPVPAQYLVLAHSRQVALALARRDDVWRISKLDLVNRTATDLGVLRLDVFAQSFDGTAWTIGRGEQLRVVDVDRGFESLWHISDLPGRILAMRGDAKNEYLLLSDPDRGSQIWHYRLPERRLLSRGQMPDRIHEDGIQLFSASSEVAEFRLKLQPDEEPVLIIEQGSDRRGYRLPGFDEGAVSDEALQMHLFEHWLLIGYATADQETRWHFIHRKTDRLCAVLSWPSHDVQVHCQGDDWLLFDHQGRLSHINVSEASHRKLSLN